MDKHNEQTDEELKARGLQRIIKYATVYWNDKSGWDIELHEEYQKEHARGFGDFAGQSKVECIVPIMSIKEKT